MTAYHCTECDSTNITDTTCLNCGATGQTRERMAAAYAEQDQAPAAEDQAPAAEDQAPAAEDQAPAAEDQAPAVDLFSSEWPYPELSAADFAALYTAAAGHIEARGYYPYEVQGYGDEPGLSITGGLKLAALEHVTAADPADSRGAQLISAQNLLEELETRLSAVLYVYGQAHNRTGIQDLSDVHVGWSLGHFESAASGRHTGWNNPSEAHALTLLRKAAAMFTMIADDSAPVTEADDVADAAQLARVESSACDR